MPKITITTNEGEVIDVLTDGLGGDLELPGVAWAECKQLGTIIEETILEALQEAERKEDEHLTRAELIAEREMIQAGQPVVNEDGS